MAKTTVAPLDDVQARPDSRNVTIDQVGVCALRHPLTIVDRSDAQPVTALCNLYVELPGAQKGAHISRFVEVLHAQQQPLSTANFGELLAQVGERLEAVKCGVELSFAYFIAKHAPVSGARSWMDYQVTFSGERSASHDGQHSAQHNAQHNEMQLKVTVPVTSLCPCSKAVAEYGAHNQRSHVTLCVTADGSVGIEELIELAERNASSELYALLKREDEKHITEKAYDQPKFVEDLARDLAQALNRDARVLRYEVCVENFESIHNHSAFARIRSDKSK